MVKDCWFIFWGWGRDWGDIVFVEIVLILKFDFMGYNVVVNWLYIVFVRCYVSKNFSFVYKVLVIVLCICIWNDICDVLMLIGGGKVIGFLCEVVVYLDMIFYF